MESLPRVRDRVAALVAEFKAKVYKKMIHIFVSGIAIALIVICALGSFFHHYHPDPLEALAAVSSFAIVALTVLRRPILLLYSFLETRVSEIIALLDRSVLTSLAISSIIATFCSYILVDTSMEFIKRYRYVHEIRQSVKAVISDEGILPKTEKLAQTYLKYPGRREVPVILVRTSRIFSFGGRWRDFVAFQASYADQLFESFANLPEHCSIDGVDHDPVSYVVTTYVESSVPLKDDRVSPNGEFTRRLREAINFLAKCIQQDEASATRRIIPRMIYAMRIKSVLAKYDETYDFDTTSEIANIEEMIGKLKPSDLVWLFQSHAFQEFLDFKIKTIIQMIVPECGDYQDKEVQEVIANMRRLLSLRMTQSIDNEIRWIRPPQKMDTYRLFMAKGGFLVATETDLLSFVEKSVAMTRAVNAILDAPAFQVFLRPEAWFKSTPVDLSIDGASLEEKFEDWLKKGW